MKNHITHITLLFISLFIFFSCTGDNTTHTDILIVGGGASGTAAGLQASRMGSNTLIIEESTWLGGMLTSAGVSATDGNYRLPGGIWGEFRKALAVHYGGLDSLNTGWVSKVLFEPSVGNEIFKKMAENEKHLDIWYKTSLNEIQKDGDSWKVTVTNDGITKTIQAKIVIDATELGDVAKACGVGYDIGMDSRHNTKERIAPEEKNDIIQDLTYVAVLKDYGKDVTIPRPAGYDSTVFACACINDLCIDPKEPNRMWSSNMMITYGKLPNNKYMINWPLEGNDYYLNIIEMSPAERTEALKKAKEHTMHFIYFLQKEIGFNTLGLADDEFPTEDRLPFIPYHRESRRIHGEVQFTVDYITDPYTQDYKLYRTSIGVGDYPVDHHHARYPEHESLPDLHFYPVPSYGLPMGTLIPKEADGLIVAEKSISVSNLVNGTTRLQPVVLQIGQAAGALASLAVKNGLKVKQVPVRDVQNEILAAGGYLLPYLDIPVDHPSFGSYQRVGSTGILKGTGKNVNWSNETWLRADTVLLASEVEGLKDVYPSYTPVGEKKNITIGQAMDIIVKIAETENINTLDIETKAKNIFTENGLSDFNPERDIKRGEFAVLVDNILDPFNKKAVDIYGNFKDK